MDAVWPPTWRAVDPRLHFPNEPNSLPSANLSADQRNSFRITEDVMLACVAPPDDADVSKPIQSLFEPCEGYELESRLEELDQGYRECHARLARIDASAAESADWLAAKLEVLKEALLAPGSRPSRWQAARLPGSIAANASDGGR